MKRNRGYALTVSEEEIRKKKEKGGGRELQSHLSFKKQPEQNLRFDFNR